MSKLVAILELAAEVARKHERTTDGQIKVIPVIVDDLETTLPVLLGLCQVAEGSFFSAQDLNLGGAVPATDDLARLAGITTALVGQPLTSRRVELFNPSGGLIDARFAEPPNDNPSAGEQEVLAVARAVAHRDLDRTSFAVIAYRAALVDFPFRRGIWSLAVDQLNGLPHKTLRTIVFVAETSIDIDAHCQPGRGFVLAVEGGRLLRRKPPEDLRIQVASIVNNDGAIVLFLGAGFSGSSHMPLGNSMRDQAIRRLLTIPASEALPSTELASQFYGYVSDQGWLTTSEQRMSRDEFVFGLTLEQVIRIEKTMYPALPTLQEFRSHHDSQVDKPGQAVQDLAAILDHGKGRVIVVEVNFDELVERHTKVPFKVFSSPNDFADAPQFIERYLAGVEASIPILKLHGSISDPDTCVVNVEQTEHGIGKDKREALRALLNTTDPRRWIYVGASLRDLDLRPFFLGEEFGEGVDERWVTPYLPESLDQFGVTREPVWRGRSLETMNDRIITETADAFFAALRVAWMDRYKVDTSQDAGG